MVRHGQLSSCAIEFFGKRSAVHGVDAIEDLRGTGGLVFLQVTNHVPSGPEMDQLRPLGLPFLDTIFAKMFDSGRVQFFDLSS